MKPIFYLRRLTHRRRRAKYNRDLGLVLAFVAGATNAGGFLAVHQYTSHMTGIVSSIADNLASGSFDLALAALGSVACFVGGAMSSAILINWARRRRLHSQFALSLVWEALLLLCFGLLGSHLAQDILIVPITALLLCYIMGLQNAIITKISHAEIRTTHMTGIVTDLGIELGRLVYWNADKKRKPFVQANRPHLFLLAGLVSMFIVGGMAGAFGFKYVGFKSTVALATLLLGLAIVPVLDDIWIGFKKWRRG